MNQIFGPTAIPHRANNPFPLGISIGTNRLVPCAGETVPFVTMIELPNKGYNRNSRSEDQINEVPSYMHPFIKGSVGDVISICRMSGPESGLFPFVKNKTPGW